MPRRTSSRLRGGAPVSGGSAGASDGESSGGGCPMPPSPGKRKARSPVEDGGPGHSLANPNPVRCAASFQSPKKRAQQGGIGDRPSAAPLDKENDLNLSSSSSAFAAPAFGDGGGAGGIGSFRLSAFSAFSQHAPSAKPGDIGARRRGREETAAPVHSPSTPRVPTAGGSSADGKGPVLPFLLAPASLTRSPDLRRKAASRRAPRSGRGSNAANSSGGSSSSSSSSSSGGIGLRRSRDSSSPSPLLVPPLPTVPTPAAATSPVYPSSSLDPPTSTPRRGRYSVRSGAGCAAGGRRAATATVAAAAAAATATASSAESLSAASPTEGTNSGGGGPAGSSKRAVGGPRLGPGGGGGGDTMSDHSPHRSPIHRLTESLQKWDPGSRYTSPAEDNGNNKNNSVGERIDLDGGDGDEEGMDAGASGSGAGVAGVKEVGASWNGQELRRTLEKERLGRGRRRRHSAASAQDMYPQARFGDHSPISPASSAASVNVGEFDASTPAIAGRPWRSSPRRAEGGAAVSEGGSSSRGKGDDRSGSGEEEGAGSAEHFGIVRMEGSWSEDETGPSGTVMKLAFSPGKISADAQTPTGLTPTGAAAAASALGKSGRSGAGAAAAAAAAPSTARWQYPFSPVKKGQRTKGSSTGGGNPRSPFLPSESQGADLLVPSSPEQPSLRSVRDLMDQGTDDEDGGGGGPGDSNQAALVRRRRRRQRPELALRTLEMPDAMDTTTVEGVSRDAAAAAGGDTAAAATGSAKSMPNPLVSPAFTGKGPTGAGFGSGCTTTCRRWEGSAPLLEGPSGCAHDTPVTAAASSGIAGDDSWIRERGGGGNGKGRDWGASSTMMSSGFGIGGAGEDGPHDVSGGGLLSEENSSVVTLGMSGLADTSSASESSVSFVRSRPIPDQSAFSSSRLSKAGPHSPLGSGGGSGGGPAVGPAPVCLTPRKSIMRCPPTPQRTPTWDGLEDSLLLEGAGSGGRARGGVSSALSSRSCLRQSKLLACNSDDVGGSSGITGMTVDVGLANASSSCSASSSSSSPSTVRRSSPRFETTTAAVAAIERGSGGRGFGDGGRGGRGRRSTRDRSSAAGGVRGGGPAGQKSSTDGAAGSASGSPLAAAPVTAAAADSTLGFKNDFVQMGPIGEGGFSVVWKVRAKGTGRLYAIKRSKREFRGRRDRDRCLLEARALQRLGEHPGVLRFERAWQEEGHFCLQTELCELGTLKDFLERLPVRREIPEPAVWQVLHDVGQALRHVHATGLVHLDVKPANLLIGNEGGRLKLADFGMATAYGEGMEGIGDGQEGDTLYMAKELLSSTARLPSADMFSLGLTVYEVATRIELPGDGQDWHAMRDGTAAGLPSSRSQDLSAVLRQLMHPDPRQRPTADALCQHPRVANITGISTTSSSHDSSGTGGTAIVAEAGGEAAPAPAGHERDDYVVNQARAWRAAEAAAMDHPSSGLRTPTGDMSVRYIFQQPG